MNRNIMITCYWDDFVWQALFLACGKNEDALVIAISRIPHTADTDLTVRVAPSEWKETNE